MSKGTSPLRYPGGKTSMLGLTASILRANNLSRGHYAEPYAGGCGLALALLYGGHVSDIHINDIDPAIWSFWHCVLENYDAFADRIERTPVTISEWMRQREVYRAQVSNPLDLGFAAFFLNRTNRSGIIKAAGVIGGIGQQGDYKLDCRYNRDDLIRRIGRVHKYKDRIHLTNLDALEFLNRCQKRLPADSLMFIDPPYYGKGAGLYTSFYRPEDHAKVAAEILKVTLPWVVTYDDVPEIRSLYKSRRQFGFDINYSLQNKRVGNEILIASKGLRLPDAFRARQINRPQYRDAA